MASPDRRVVRLMADQTWARVSRERRPTFVAESKRMRIHAVATGQTLRCVARRAVTLGMTRDTCVQVSHGFPRVVVRASRCRREFVRRRMKTSTSHPIARCRVTRHARTSMTIGAERFELMATDASRVVLPRALRMHRHPVVRMHFARTNASVMTIGAFVLGVTTTAEGAVVCRH